MFCNAIPVTKLKHFFIYFFYINPYVYSDWNFDKNVNLLLIISSCCRVKIQYQFKEAVQNITEGQGGSIS